MVNEVLLDKLAQDVRGLNRSRPQCLEEAVEHYLEGELRETPFPERLSLLHDLVGKFSGDTGGDAAPAFAFNSSLNQEEMARVISLLSGTSTDLSGISPRELSEKFAASLNTLFDALNQMIGVIQANLLGEKPELETIRHVIGSQIEGRAGEASLESYVERIRQAFLVSHQAFQEAGRSVVGEMLDALDPDSLAGPARSFLSFGPMRKAEILDSYREKYRECREWFDSGRFAERLLREFEKTCQQRYKISD